MGSEEPVFELVLLSGVAVLSALWGARQLLEGPARWPWCLPTLSLATLVVVGSLQTISLSKTIIRGISPGTAASFDRLLPAERETLRSGEPLAATPLPAGHALSHYPGVTRREVIHLLAVLALFVVTRENASIGRLKRLSILALANGSLVSLIGLFLAFYSQGREMIYGLIPVQGANFGPFIYRNHYACYTNLCIGMGLGLFFAAGARRAPGAKRIWIGAALVLMIGGLIYCQCRGGILVLVVTGLAVLVWQRTVPGLRSFVGGLAMAAAAALLLSVLGFDWGKARLASVWDNSVLNDARFDIWAGVFPRIAGFPLLGAGYGTYPYIDQPTQGRSDYHVMDYAHNDYLEGLLEGGVVRLTLSVWAVVLVLCYAGRAVRLGSGEQKGLALGGTIAFGTLVIHMAGDYVIHLPAITFLATVLSAHLCALGRSSLPTPAPINSRLLRGVSMKESGNQTLGRIVAIASCLGAIAVGGVIALDGWRSYRSHRLLLAGLGVGVGRQRPVPADRIACLEAAVAYSPECARLRALLGDAHLDCYEERREECQTENDVALGVDAFLFAASAKGSSGFAAALVDASRCVAAARTRAEKADRICAESAAIHISAALSQHVLARDLCPLMAKPHVRIAANREWFAHADTRATYLGRAHSLVPHDAELWYLGGVQEMADGQPRQAARSWKRSLTVSEDYLQPILAHASLSFSPEQVMDQVLPDNPNQIMAAADLFFPETADLSRRRPFLEKAVDLLNHPEGSLLARDYALRARLNRSLNLIANAVADYQTALTREPAQSDWRYELAALLVGQGRSTEAQRELQAVLRSDPGHTDALKLTKSLSQGTNPKRTDPHRDHRAE
jgi:O-antigen ligase/tetratricopeptide (TPR) repeat protein